ncbi:MAG: SDR family oxidoreductase [Geovibrio sp.]|nr:SDR family oxidoreductase [Geovibrio sp.]
MKKNKLVLVTGGSRGLGKNIAIQLAEKGFDVIITYHNKEREALEVAKSIHKIGRKSSALKLDIGKVESIEPFFDHLSRELRTTFKVERFDYLVNNAGIGMSMPFMEVTEEQFDLLLNVLFKGLFFFTQKAVTLMNNYGGIVNISSRLAQSSMDGYAVYASMKGAIETLTRYQAKELSHRYIRVNTVAPGPIATDFAGGIIRDNVHYNAKVKELTALGRVGEPEDIGGVIAFLCSEEAKWITAQRIEVSGGMCL